MSEAPIENTARKRNETGRDPVYLVISFCLMLVVALLNFGLKPAQQKFFPVRYVRVQGSFDHLQMSELESTIGPLLENGFLELDVERIRSRMRTLAWIRSVQIQRVWPDTLVIRGDEHVPFARFGETQLLSIEGFLFTPPTREAFDALPWIAGPADRASDCMAAFQKLQNIAKDAGITIQKLQISARDSWLVEDSQGLSIELGRRAPIDQFKRFVGTLTLLGENPIQSMRRVDLRYSNGYAVEWKIGGEPSWAAPEHQLDSRPKKATRRI